MKTLLHIDSSPRDERSYSRRLTAKFACAWLCANPDGAIVHRELGLTPVPLVSEHWIAAAFSQPENHTSEQKAAIAISNELVDELIAADELVIGAPMYNFGVTASLKAWIDQVVRVGRTIDYPSYAGLVQGKKATIITTRGNAAFGSVEQPQLDSQVPYLKQILGFIGITDVSVVYAGGLAGSEQIREKSLQIAAAEAEARALR